MENIEKRRATQKRYRERHPERVKANVRKWRLANKEKQALQNKNWKKNNPEKVKALHEKYRKNNKTYYSRYMRAWRRKQLEVEPPYEPPAHCEACGVLFEPTPQRRYCLDHCHDSNRFRGWLCSNCNIALGLAGDTSDGVRRLLEYIVRAEAMLDSQLLK